MNEQANRGSIDTRIMPPGVFTSGGASALVGEPFNAPRANPATTARQPSAKELLRERANSLRMAAAQLDAICDMTPECPTPDQENALRFIATAMQLAV